MRLQEVLSKLRTAKPMLAQRYPIGAMGVFGSTARGSQGPDSDVDILVEFNGPMGLNFVDLADELEEMLGTKVDLVSKQGVKPGYLEVISKDLIHV
jgi:predicted nucleotidyltransferase